MASVVTPEAVRLDYPVGGIASRAFAKAIDLLLLLVTAGLLQWLLGVAVRFARNRGAFGFETADVVERILVALAVFFVAILLVPLCEARWNGRTPGKALVGLRVMTEVGETIGFGHAFVRSLVGIVEIPTGIALLAALSNSRNQRLGDLSAATFVAHDRRQLVAPLLTPTIFPPPAGCWPVVAAIDVSTMTSRQFTFVRDYLLRVTELTPEARYELGWMLVYRLRPQINAWPPAGMPPERFVNCVASAYQLRHFNGVLPPTIN